MVKNVILLVLTVICLSYAIGFNSLLKSNMTITQENETLKQEISELNKIKEQNEILKMK